MCQGNRTLFIGFPHVVQQRCSEQIGILLVHPDEFPVNREQVYPISRSQTGQEMPLLFGNEFPERGIDGGIGLIDQVPDRLSDSISNSRELHQNLSEHQ